MSEEGYRIAGTYWIRFNKRYSNGWEVWHLKEVIANFYTEKEACQYALDREEASKRRWEREWGPLTLTPAQVKRSQEAHEAALRRDRRREHDRDCGQNGW